MVEYPTLEEIHALNPHIDQEEIEKCREILHELRSLKTRGAGFNLALPFARRHIRAGEGDDVDSRTIHLSRRR